MGKRIILAEDHALIRDGLKALLTTRSAHVVVAEAADGREAVELALEHEPDIVLMDVMMPELNGIEATRQILDRLPRTAIIMLSMYKDPQYVAAAMAAGAVAYLVKDCLSADLLDVIEAVGAGQRHLVRGIGDSLDGDDEVGTVLDRLSPRETEILQLFAEGNGTKEIAFKLSVSPKTIETHRANISSKLECHSLVDLTRLAIRKGLIEP